MEGGGPKFLESGNKGRVLEDGSREFRDVRRVRREIFEGKNHREVVRDVARALGVGRKVGEDLRIKMFSGVINEIVPGGTGSGVRVEAHSTRGFKVQRGNREISDHRMLVHADKDVIYFGGGDLLITVASIESVEGLINFL